MARYAQLSQEAGSRQLEFPVMVAICAWCKPRRGAVLPPTVTHGICPRHLRKMRLELESKRKG